MSMNTVPLPSLLAEIPDPPQRLYIRGTLPVFNEKICIAVVGSRRHTIYGMEACQKIINGLAGYPVVIISGLAVGMDTIAHESALKAGLPCVAVPGSGLDDSVLYPSQNRGLAHKILENNGCLLSEYEPLFKATRWSFPRRNRIMAGLAHAVLVIESEKHSGTKITAGLATEYDREVLVVPGSIVSSQSEGCNELLQQGALLVTSAKDIICYFNIKRL